MDKKRLNEILTQLNNSDTDIVLNVLKDIRDEGSNELLQALASLYISSNDTKIKSAIAAIFNDLKNQDSANEIVKILKTTDNDDLKKMLLSSCWQSRLNYLDFLEVFIDYVLLEKFEISFEAFSVVENIEVKTSTQRKQELKNYILSNIGKCIDENMALANDLESIVNNYEEI